MQMKKDFFVYVNFGHCSFNFIFNNNLKFCFAQLIIIIFFDVLHMQKHTNQEQNLNIKP